MFYYFVTIHTAPNSHTPHRSIGLRRIKHFFFFSPTEMLFKDKIVTKSTTDKTLDVWRLTMILSSDLGSKHWRLSWGQ